MTISRSLNIEQKFKISILIVILSISALSVTFIYQFVAKHFTEYTNEFWQDHTNIFANSAVYSVIMRQDTQSEMIAKSFSGDKSIISANIFLDSQSIISSSPEHITCQSFPLSTMAIETMLETEDRWCFYAALTHESIKIGVVELVVSKYEYKSRMTRLLVASIGIVLLVSLVILFFVAQLSRTFTSTLLEIDRVMKKFKAGERGHRVNFTGATELDSIRMTLNDMLEEKELLEQNLERRIAERTGALQIALESSETANVYKNQIMSIVSHEMKTPINSLKLLLENLEERLPVNSDYKENCDLHRKVNLSVQALQDLINSILDHARLESNQYGLSFDRVNIYKLISDSAERFSSIAKKNNNTIAVLGNEFEMVTDKGALSNIINNLLSNALKFTHGGAVKVKWSVAGGYLAIDVIDAGCGIPDEYKQKVFDPWWQVDMSHRRRIGGSGLGLSITKQFTERLGGTISVSDNKEGGSIFSVKIPC